MFRLGSIYAASLVLVLCATGCSLDQAGNAPVRVLLKSAEQLEASVVGGAFQALATGALNYPHGDLYSISHLNCLGINVRGNGISSGNVCDAQAELGTTAGFQSSASSEFQLYLPALSGATFEAWGMNSPSQCAEFSETGMLGVTSGSNTAYKIGSITADIALTPVVTIPIAFNPNDAIGCNAPENVFFDDFNYSHSTMTAVTATGLNWEDCTGTASGPLLNGHFNTTSISVNNCFVGRMTVDRTVEKIRISIRNNMGSAGVGANVHKFAIGLTDGVGSSATGIGCQFDYAASSYTTSSTRVGAYSSNHDIATGANTNSVNADSILTCEITRVGGGQVTVLAVARDTSGNLVRSFTPAATVGENLSANRFYFRVDGNGSAPTSNGFVDAFLYEQGKASVFP